jgi:cobaltochelatase CobN
VDKGHPEVPREWLKTEWRKRLLPGKVHLTFSGCVGPCDISNVVVIVTDERTIWLGGIDRQSQFSELADWASACLEANAAVPLPPALACLRFDRFIDSKLVRGELA